MMNPQISLIRQSFAWIAQRARPAIAVGSIGVTLSLAAAAVVKFWGTQFLPLDYEGKITWGAALITVMPILMAAFISAVIAGVPTLCAWRNLPNRIKAAGMAPATLILIVWLMLITFTGM